MTLSEAVECFRVGQEAKIVEWYERKVETHLYGPTYFTTLVLRALDSGHGMLPAFESTHREIRAVSDIRRSTVEAPLAVGLTVRHCEVARGDRTKPKFHYFVRLPISPNG